MYQVVALNESGKYGIQHIGSGKEVEVRDCPTGLLSLERLASRMNEEAVEPEHMEAVINDYIEDETKKNIAAANKVLNALVGMCEEEGYSIEETGCDSSGRSAIWQICTKDASIMVTADVFRKVDPV